MKNIEIKTKVITNSIVREIRDTAHKNIDIRLVAATVREILSDDGLLDAIKNVAWDEDDKKVSAPSARNSSWNLHPTVSTRAPSTSSSRANMT